MSIFQILEEYMVYTHKFYCITMSFLLSYCTNAQFISISPRSVPFTHISLYPMFGDSLLRPIAMASGVASGQTALMEIPPRFLPGEFTIRFDYATDSGTTYPSEMRVWLGRENVHVSLDPRAASRPESIDWGSDKENLTYHAFLKENESRRSRWMMLAQWLQSETPSGKGYYRKSLRELERRRQDYNHWIDSMSEAHASLFVSHLMRVSKAGKSDFGADPSRTPATDFYSMLDIQDTFLLRASQFRQLLDAFVQQRASAARTQAGLDSIILQAADDCLRFFQSAHPLLYARVIDYYFEGFERNAIDEGFPLLARHALRPDCPSRRREDILRKTALLGKAAPGQPAIDVFLPLENAQSMLLSSYVRRKPRTLVLFWSASCSHCTELVRLLYPYSQRADIRSVLQVVAISLDHQEPDRSIWRSAIDTLRGWDHVLCTDGVRSPQASAYGVLSTPTMYLIDREGMIIRSRPENMQELSKAMKVKPLHNASAAAWIRPPSPMMVFGRSYIPSGTPSMTDFQPEMGKISHSIVHSY